MLEFVERQKFLWFLNFPNHYLRDRPPGCIIPYIVVGPENRENCQIQEVFPAIWRGCPPEEDGKGTCMKRLARILTLCFLTAALLAGTAYADFGPKPQLTVKVENGPEEPYYLDLLAEGPLSGGWVGPSWDVEQAMERGEIDPELLDALCKAVPEG